MKKTISSLVLLMMTQGAMACDEACKKQAAMDQHNIKLPGYLSWKYCESTKDIFMSSTLRGLQRYSDQSMAKSGKTGLNNTKKHIDREVAALEECDNYYQLTDNGRLFNDKATTEKVFKELESIDTELETLMGSISHSTQMTPEMTSMAQSRFEQLFKTVDDHKALMHLRGYVSR